ncbi:MAG: 4'-phosphopantetheinyl transferase superfamily protein [Ignavibacteriaceae bacterium]
MNLKLNPDQIIICTLDMSTISEKKIILDGFLSSSELDRSEKFKFENDKYRYITSRSVLRNIIGKLLSLDPKLIKFLTNEFGKPFLDPAEYSNLKFNLSHSGDQIVYAFCLNTDVGIDIEYINYSINHIELANSFFTANEINFLLNSAHEKNNIEKFFSIWTRKEALLKSIGTGLMPDIKTIDVLEDQINLDIFLPEFKNHNTKTVFISEILIHKDYKTAIASAGNINSIQIEKIEY